MKDSRFLDDLDERQRSAVTAPPGPLLILAGPGSGKTRILVARAAWLLRERLARPEEILAITFTNKAAEEMKDRLRAMLGGDVESRLFAGTFHSFALRLLRRYREEAGLLEGFAVLDEEGQNRAISMAIENLNFSRTAYPLYEVRDYISHRKENLQSPEEPLEGDFRDEGMAKIAAEYRSILERQRLLDFDDILVRAVDLLGRNRSLRVRLQASFKHILVDEFHDINRAQFEILVLLAPKGWDISVVADEDQSIYSWRGADPTVIRRFEKHYRPRVVELSQNYRSTETILHAAQSLIGNSPGRMREGRMKAYTEGGYPITVYYLKSVDEEAKVVRRIVEGLHESDFEFRDIAILYRTHRISEPVERALLRAGIPVQRIRPKALWQTDLRPMYALLRLLVHPDSFSLGEAINFPQVILDDLTAVRAGDISVTDPAALGNLPPLSRYNLREFWDGISRLQSVVDKGAEFVLGEALAWVRRRVPPWKQEELPGRSIGGLLGGKNQRVAEAAGMLEEALLESYLPAVREAEGIAGSAARALLSSALPVFVAGGKTSKAAVLPPLNALEAFAALHSALVSTEEVGKGEFVVYDLETTGGDPTRDEIVEIGAVKLRDRKEVGRFHSLVRPGRPISAAAQAVHHISWKELEGAPTIEEVLPRFLDFVGDAPLVGHNIRGFDNLILDRAMSELQGIGFRHPSVDTLALARHLWPGEPSYSLERLLGKAGLGGGVPHRALEDARLEASLFFFLWQELREKQALLALMPWLPLAVIGSEPDELLLELARRYHSVAPETSRLEAWVQKLSPEEEWEAMPWLQEFARPADESYLEAFRKQEAPLWELWRRFKETGSGNGLAEFLDFVALQTDLERFDPSRDTVTMLTLHNAKGMEFRAVIILGVEQGVLPVWRAVGSPKEIAEERRVLYVGMTRAKERLYMTVVEDRDGIKRPPSQFLSEIPSKYLCTWRSGGSS